MVQKTEISPELKCQQNEMSLKLKCHRNLNVPKTKMLQETNFERFALIALASFGVLVGWLGWWVGCKGRGQYIEDSRHQAVDR